MKNAAVEGGATVVEMIYFEDLARTNSQSVSAHKR